MATVSVLLPTYNCANYIGEAIESVLAQTFTDFELIIVDNCSTDNTKEAIQKYLKDKRVRYHSNEQNIGLIGNFNQCLSLATAPFIKILCADDTIHPEYLEKSVAVFQDHPSVVFVSSFYEEFGPFVRPMRAPVSGLVNGKEIVKLVLKTSNFLGCPSQVIFRKEALKEQKFLEMSHWNADLELFFRVIATGDCFIIPEVLSYARLHQAQTSSNIIKSYAHYFGDYELVKIMHANSQLFPFSKKEFNKIIKEKAARCSLATPKMLLRVYKKSNRKILKKAVRVAIREKAFTESAQVFAARIIKKPKSKTVAHIIKLLLFLR